MLSEGLVETPFLIGCELGKTAHSEDTMPRWQIEAAVSVKSQGIKRFTWYRLIASMNLQICNRIVQDSTVHSTSTGSSGDAATSCGYLRGIDSS
jgi:hypothetical protein